MVSHWQGFTCPKCKGSMRARSTGRANDGRYVVRTRTCEECAFKGITVEGFLSGSDGMTSIESFDEEQKFARRERRRKREGFHGVGCGHLKSVKRVTFASSMRGGEKVKCGHAV